MEELFQVLSASIEPVTLPFTVALIVVVLYWLSVGVGILDLDQLEVGAGSGQGADPDLPVPAGGASQSLLQFMNGGEVPLTVVGSFLILGMWALSILGNHYINPSDSIWISLALLLPNFFLAAVVTRYATKPFRTFFRALNRNFDEAIPIVGSVCRVVTGEVTEVFGQAEVETKGAPITIQVRTKNRERLRRGDQALVVGEEQENGVFHVVKFEDLKVEKSL